MIKELGFLDWGPFSFAVEAGECLGLSGASGSGKSLLLRAIADLDVHQGNTWLNQTRASEISGPDWRSQVAMLPAESQWWCDRIGEHPGILDDRLLVRLGFDGDVVEWPVSRLSAGERQRLGLVRLLSRQPKAMLLDEPTANLDDHHASQVERLIEDYRRDELTPVIWVSHDKEQLNRVANRQLRFENKKLVIG